MGFFTKRLLRAFKLLTNTVNLHEMNRAYVCPKLICAGTVFLGKHLAGPDATFRSIKLTSAQHPLCAPGLLGASGGKVPKAKAAEATQNSGITPEPSRLGQPPAEVHSEGLHSSCPYKAGSRLHLPVALLNYTACPTPRRASIFVDFTKEISHLS